MIARKRQDKQMTIRRKTMMILLFVCVLSYGLFVYQSYARYHDNILSRDFDGSMEFAFYNGDQKLDTIPLKESGAVFIRSECDNGATVKWDSDNWAPAVYNLKNNKTSCTLYFGSIEDRACYMHPDGAACEYYKKGETAELLYDDTEDKNLRYVGATPNNYVYFNCEEGKIASDKTCEIWRIIGIMNNIEDEDGSVGGHIKIIRDKFEKGYSWDSSAYGVNRGYGVNEWSEADIEKVLNDEYLYRRAGSNLCFKDSSNTKENCPDWASIGIKDEARSMIASVKWHTGTMSVPENLNSNFNLITAKYMYEAEQSNHHGKEWCQASGGQYCNDGVSRTTLWIGKVGLMYPSDYGYAVGGDVRTTCLKKSMFTYDKDNCMTNDWLYDDKGNIQWTMTPVIYSSYACNAFSVLSGGIVSGSNAYHAFAVRPVVYLTPSVKIMDGSGETGNPFVLEM